MFPWDYQNNFNDLIADYGLNYAISCTLHDRGLFDGQMKIYEFVDIVEENINKGMPVTFMTGLIGQFKGPYAQHTTNIFGYQKWMGVNLTTGQTIEKYLIMSRINRGDSYDSYYLFDDTLFGETMTYLVTYDIKYETNHNIYASDFSNAFVNEYGQGQYFYDEKYATILTNDNYIFNTARLRCSYIENKYLVLSSNRENVDYAHLTFKLMHNVGKITFDVALWSSFGNELFSRDDTFVIQYFNGTDWIDHVNIDLKYLSLDKDSKDHFIVLFNKNVTTFRFYLKHVGPMSDRNKGRVVLDNFCLSYN